MDRAFPFNPAVLQERAGLAGNYPDSFVALDDAALWLEADGGQKHLAVLARPASAVPARFTGAQQPSIDDYVLKRCPADAANARALRDTLAWLRPAPLGLTTCAIWSRLHDRARKGQGDMEEA